MHRRRALAALASFAVSPALAQPRLRAVRRIQRIAIVFYGTPANSKSRHDAFVAGMRELGYEDGKNVRYNWLYANGQPDLAARHAIEITREVTDVVVSFSTNNTTALREAGMARPVVMIAIDDPVRGGFARDLARPGTNFTGMTTDVVSRAPKYVDFLIDALSRIPAIGLLASPASTTYKLFRSRVEDEAARRGSRVVPIDAATPDDIDRAILRNHHGVQGLIVTSDSMFYNERRHIVELVNGERLPAIYPRVGYVEAGGLMSYGPNDDRFARRAAKFVARIIEGEAPENMAIESPEAYELAVNRRAAKAIGLELPPTLLKKADRLVG